MADDIPGDDDYGGGDAGVLLYRAWTIIANVNQGDWSGETPEWQDAAIGWRDAFHRWFANDDKALESRHD